MQITFNRRTFVSLALAAIPGLAIAQTEDGVVLTAEPSRMSLVAGMKTPVWRFESNKPAAILKAKQGEVFKGKVVNKLPQELWLHWFGIRAEASAITINVPAGGSADFSFTPPDAGTFWFGPMLRASEQRDRGLYGMLIVEGAGDAAFTDVPLIVDDWPLDDKSKLKEDFGNLEAAIGEGRLGNWFTVNGAFKSKINCDAAKPVRLRFLNASNARTMRLDLSEDEVKLLALDGQPVPMSDVAGGALDLLPGQRADVVLPRLVRETILSLGFQDDTAQVAFLVPQNLAPPGEPLTALPPNPLPVFDAANAVTQQLLLQGGARGGLKTAKVGDADLDTRQLLEKGLAWAMNGIAGVNGPPLFTVQAGQSVILDIDNQTAFPQPLHIHGHIWQALEVDGASATNQPWRDTVVVPGQGRAKLGFVASSQGLWPIQSLIAERSDSGLIGAFQVNP